VDAQDVAALKAKVLASGLTMAQLVGTAWASASHLPRQRQARRCQRRTHPPGTAKRLGSQPARRNWPRCCKSWKPSRKQFNAAQTGGKKVSMADLIVLAGSAAMEAAAKRPATA
jgi:catalase-peroxidase